MRKYLLSTKDTKGLIERARHALPLQLRDLRVLRGEQFLAFLVAALPHWALRGAYSSTEKHHFTKE
jgi:hypothetical protein